MLHVLGYEKGWGRVQGREKRRKIEGRFSKKHLYSILPNSNGRDKQNGCPFPKLFSNFHGHVHLQLMDAMEKNIGTKKEGFHINSSCNDDEKLLLLNPRPPLPSGNSSHVPHGSTRTGSRCPAGRS